RKRRTRRHRRNILARRIVIGMALITVGACASFFSLQHLTPSLFHIARVPEPTAESLENSRNDVLQAQDDVLRDIESRPVYPYSIVRGGVKSARELKWVADHDPVVAAHYAGFDYDHARVVRLVLARTVYLSYRIGDKVYWTRHRVTLKKGESVLTD